MPTASTAGTVQVHFYAGANFKRRLKAVAAIKGLSMGALLIKLTASEINRLYEQIGSNRKGKRSRKESTAATA
jgi:hypothetical protein